MGFVEARGRLLSLATVMWKGFLMKILHSLTSNVRWAVADGAEA